MAALDPDLNSLVNAADYLGELPPIFADAIDRDSLRDIWLVPPSTTRNGEAIKVSTGIVFDQVFPVFVPGLDALQLAIGGVGDLTIFEIEIDLRPEVKLTIKDVAVSLRFRSEYFKPARLDTATNKYEVDPSREFVDLMLGTLTFSVDQSGGFDVSTGAGATLPPTMIGDSGVVIEASGVQVYFNDSATPPGKPAGTRGVSFSEVTLHLPDTLGQGLTLSFQEAFIGNGGFSGTVDQAITPGVDLDFGGMPVTLEGVKLEITQNALEEASLRGTMLLPYFDKRVSVEITVGLDGRLALLVTGVAPGDGSYDPNTGITSLTAGPLTFALERLGVELVDGNAIVHAGAKVQPDIDGIQFPALEIRDLSIDRYGRLAVAGGLADLPIHVSVSLFGFTLEITRVSFGSLDNGDPFIAFSGGLKLVDGLKAGASVEGFRVSWNGVGEVSLSLEGVGIDLKIPNVLSLKGAVSLRGQEFRGAVELVLEAIDFAAGGQFVAGKLDTGEKYFAIYVHGELPAGIPLGATGLGLYGFAGLYAHNMVPDKQPGEGWYLNPDGSDGWYLRKPPGSIVDGVENLQKWKGSAGGLGFGAGITLGTLPDNGQKFNGRLLLVLSFPGPIIVIEGKANILKKRSALDEEPNFRALAIIEAKKSFLLALDARYKFKAGGELLDIAGNAEAFFDFTNGSNWHIWLGHKDVRNRRIRARLFQLFNVDSYFMLSPREFDTGASWSIDQSYKFGPLRVSFGASLEVAASVSWNPAHFSGSIAVQGHAELRAFGIGVGLSIGASISGEVFDPMRLVGTFNVRINCPWPLPDPKASITLKWERRLEAPPLLPLPLREASIEIPARSLTWPFKRGTNLVPDYDQGELQYANGSPPTPSFTLDQSLLVPVDSYLGLAFSRPTADTAGIGNNPSAVSEDVIGDPVTIDKTRGYAVSYSLTSVTLEKLGAIAPSETPGAPLLPGQLGIGWVTTGQAGGTLPSGVEPLFGSWTLAGTAEAPEAQQKLDGIVNDQTKLLVNAKSPFEATMLASREHEQWFSEANPGYPCVAPEYFENFVAVFDQPVGTVLDHTVPGSFTFERQDFTVEWTYGGDVTANDEVVAGVLGPVDRGVLVNDDPPDPEDPPTSSIGGVIPPPGSSEVSIRVGSPTEFSNFGGDFGRFFGSDEVSQPAELETLVGISAFRLDESGTRTELPHPHGTFLGADHGGMFVEDIVELAPAVPASIVELTLFGQNIFGDGVLILAQAEVILFDDAGSAIGQPVSVLAGERVLFLKADGCARVRVRQISGYFIVERVRFRTPVVAVATRASDPSITYGPFYETDGLIQIQGEDLGRIALHTPLGGDFLVLELAVPSRYDEVIRHTVEALSQFDEAGPVFEPDTHYRFTVRTKRVTSPRSGESAAAALTAEFVEQAYFRTAALPGLGVPKPPEGTQTGSSDPAVTPATGFEDLEFYVKSTTPEVPPPAGGHRTPGRAAYRAYDANVEFRTETPYVELMYRLGRRDLSLRLFDSDGEAVRSASGRIAIGDATWGQSSDPTIADTTQRWIGLVNGASCRATPAFDPSHVVRSEVFSAPSEAIVLPPEALHQARLVPMLLHETFVDMRAVLFADGVSSRLDRWFAANGSATPSEWRVTSETVTRPGGEVVVLWYAAEHSGAPSELVYEGPLAGVADTARDDHPTKWRDLRASVQLRWSSGEVGLVARRSDAGALRVVLVRGAGEDVTARLESVSSGVASVLGEATFTSPVTADVTLTLECIAGRADVFTQGVGEALADSILGADGVQEGSGTVALYANGSASPRFSDVRVHDLGESPKAAHRFDFITSKYTNFGHHAHDFDDVLFDAPSGSGVTAADLASANDRAVAVPPPAGTVGLGSVSTDEHRAFEKLEELTLGAEARRIPERLEITRASSGSALRAFLIRSPEPLRWERLVLEARLALSPMPLGSPDALKLTRVTFSSVPEEECVMVLVRAPVSLEGHRVEWRPMPTEAEPDPEWSLYYAFQTADAFKDGTVVRIFSAETAPTHEPGFADRFVVPGTGPATALFPAGGVELRIVDATKTLRHARAFLPDSAFVPIEMRALRKQDGTGFFLFVSPSAEAIPSTAFGLRLEFVFARDAGPDLPIWRQAGSATAEEAILDAELG